MKGICLTAVTSGLLSFAATYQAASQINSAGPFTGSMSEDWESFPVFTSSFLPNPTSMMGGQASIANGAMLVYLDSLHGGHAMLGSSGAAQVSDGVHGLLIDGFTQTVTLTWSTPVFQFGAYFAATTVPDGYLGLYGKDPNTVTVRFFGPSSIPIGADLFTYSHSYTADGGLEWHGWICSTPITSISIQGDGIAMDGLQATVPEPTATAIAILFGVGLLTHRRKTGSG